MRESTLAEDGVEMWIPHRDPSDPAVFYIYEQYTHKGAYTAHTETEHFQRDGFGDAIPRLAGRKRELYEPMV
jgi:quinol monooxygenase YgiN